MLTLSKSNVPNTDARPLSASSTSSSPTERTATTVYSGKLGACAPRAAGTIAKGTSKTYDFTVSFPDGDAAADTSSWRQRLPELQHLGGLRLGRRQPVMTRSSATIGTRARALATSAGRGLMSVLLLAILAAMAITFVPGLLGYQRYVLVGHSMEPTIHRGSLVFDEIVSVSDLRKGDVITYVPPGNVEPVTHRLISRKDGKKGGPVFRTKGDNNAVADPRKFQLDRRDRRASPSPSPTWAGSSSRSATPSCASSCS